MNKDTVVPLSEQNMLQCTPNPDDCGGTLYNSYHNFDLPFVLFKLDVRL